MMRKLLPLLTLAAVLLAGPAWAQQSDSVEKGTIEVAGFSGLVLTRQTFQDSEAGAESFTASSSVLGADLAFYLSNRLGLGIYATRTLMSFGPSTEQFSMSGVLAGPQLKYRIPMSDRVAVVLAGAGGVAKTTMSYKGSNVSSFDQIDESADGVFALGGLTLNIFLAERMSVDAGLRYTFTRITSGTGTDEASLDSSGFVGGLGFTLFLN